MARTNIVFTIISVFAVTAAAAEQPGPKSADATIVAALTQVSTEPTPQPNAFDASAALTIKDQPPGPLQDQVCEPVIVDNRATLDPNCVNRIVDIGVRKGRYRAMTRDKREMRSLCENTFLPRCRHKY